MRLHGGTRDAHGITTTEAYAYAMLVMMMRILDSARKSFNMFTARLFYLAGLPNEWFCAAHASEISRYHTHFTLLTFYGRWPTPPRDVCCCATLARTKCNSPRRKDLCVLMNTLMASPSTHTQQYLRRSKLLRALIQLFLCMYVCMYVNV